MPDLRDRLQRDLTEAVRQRNREQMRVLRTVLSAIANAEAPPISDETPTSLRSEGPIAGARNGLAAAEIPRRELNAEDVHAIVAAERDERIAAADTLATRGALKAADSLRSEAAILQRYLS